MKLLLDENLPHQMRLKREGHEVFTVAYMGWSGIDNGALLAIAAAEGFDALITNDRAIEHEHDTESLPVAVLILMARANTIEAIRLLLSRIHVALDAIRPRSLVRVGEAE